MAVYETIWFSIRALMLTLLLTRQTRIKRIRNSNNHNNLPPTQALSILSLPDLVLSLIFSHLNQVQIVQIIATHSRFQYLGKRKLMNSLYISDPNLPLKISSDIRTPFHIKFTIINKIEIFDQLVSNSKLKFVNTIIFPKHLFFGYSYLDLKSLYPFTTIIIENQDKSSFLTTLQSIQVGQLRQFTFDNSIIFQKNNHEYWSYIEELHVKDNLNCNRNLGIISNFPNLKILRFHECFNVIHDLFISERFDEIQVEQLSIFWRQRLPQEYIPNLNKIFELTKLTSLELHFCSLEELPTTYETDLSKVLSEVTNLKQLSLTSRKIDFLELVNTLKPNSLTSLHLCAISDYQPACFQFEIVYMLITQQHSIERAYFQTQDYHDDCISGLQEFDRIYQKVEIIDKSIRPINQEVIEMLRCGCSNLKQLLLDSQCYFISRNHGDFIPIHPSIDEARY